MLKFNQQFRKLIHNSNSGLNYGRSFDLNFNHFLTPHTTKVFGGIYILYITMKMLNILIYKYVIAIKVDYKN